MHKRWSPRRVASRMDVTSSTRSVNSRSPGVAMVRLYVCACSSVCEQQLRLQSHAKACRRRSATHAVLTPSAQAASRGTCAAGQRLTRLLPQLFVGARACTEHVCHKAVWPARAIPRRRTACTEAREWSVSSSEHRRGGRGLTLLRARAQSGATGRRGGRGGRRRQRRQQRRHTPRGAPARCAGKTR